MRKNAVIFSLSILLFIFVRGLHAQVPTNIPNCAAVPTLAVQALGISCGDSNNPCANTCCVDSNPQTAKRERIGADLPVIREVLKFVNLPNPLDWLFEYKTQINTNPCANGSPSTPGDLTNPSCRCIKPTEAPLETLINMCENIKTDGEKASCKDCMKGIGQSVGVWTGVGCIRSNIGSFIQETLLGWGVGLAGGISILCIMYAAFMMQTSGGEAEKIKKAQQLMTSCITGLMLIIFSVFILQLIGVRILRIPGFN
ncbi:hypothetical protein HZC27_02140 [Candidatus Roizmanbacteria bacterium]|nr:hypothetical protein [Candidatus Roizmanbacteria bacterium]